MSKKWPVDIVDRNIRRRMLVAGCSESDVIRGLAYAREQAGEYSTRQGLILAMSRVLYDDAQLADGMRYSG